MRYNFNTPAPVGRPGVTMSDEHASKDKWEYVPPAQKQLIGDDAVAQYIHEQRTAFVEYVVNESKTAIYAERFGRNALVDALHALSREGFNTTDEDGPTVVCVAHPERFHEFLNRIERTTSIARGEGLMAYGAKIEVDPSVPEDRVVCVHPAAIVPNIPHRSSFKPWLVAYGKGIAIIEIHQPASEVDA